ncbi:MAG: response regulator [Deltaproteobacteria bacterium]|nr:response regulator [Deltaproteobacteria bacterium]
MKDILIVEDGKTERERLSNLFSNEGYSVIACESVQQAEQSLNNDVFRLAILDIGLSDKSGSYLFNTIKRLGKVSYIIIFTGNPSVHLKQRFLEEGAADYIVKASPQAQNESFLNRVKEIIGDSQTFTAEGIPLEVFLGRHVMPSSQQLFLNMDNSFPACKQCNGASYKVIFSHQTQVPPDIVGQVVCSQCGRPMDPDVE